MSIYTARHLYRPEDFRRLTQVPADAPAPRPGAAYFQTDKRDWTHARKARPADYLFPATEEWIGGLPLALRPVQLCSEFPRIANLLALDWNKGAACLALLDDLLIGRREYRAGFPAGVHRELRILRELCVGIPASGE